MTSHVLPEKVSKSFTWLVKTQNPAPMLALGNFKPSNFNCELKLTSLHDRDAYVWDLRTLSSIWYGVTSTLCLSPNYVPGGSLCGVSRPQSFVAFSLSLCLCASGCPSVCLSAHKSFCQSVH